MNYLNRLSPGIPGFVVGCFREKKSRDRPHLCEDGGVIDLVAGVFLAVACVAVAGFHVAIIAGAPLGEYSYGGMTSGPLPRPLRFSSGLSVALFLAIAGHGLAQAGIIRTALPDAGNSVANWAIVGLLAVATLMNTITRSKKERNIWAPVSFVMLAAALVLML